MDVTIRKGTIEDLAEVQKLSQELFYSDFPHDPALNEKWTYQKEGEENFTKRLTETEGVCFVAEIEGNIVGYATGNILPILSWRLVKRAELENLIVTASQRGKGIGEMLAKALFDWAKSHDLERVKVSVYATNDKAIRFYKKVGFIPDSFELEFMLS